MAYYHFLLFFIHSIFSNTVMIKFSSVFIEKQYSQNQISLVLLLSGLTPIIFGTFLGSITKVFKDRNIFICFAILLVCIYPFVDMFSYGLLLAFSVINSAFLTGMNIVANHQATMLENKLKIKIISKCHGFWSIISIVASVLSYFTILFSLSNFYHFLIIDFFVIVCLIFTFNKFENEIVDNKENEKKVSMNFSFSLVIVLLALVGGFYSTIEGALNNLTILIATKEKSIEHKDAILILSAFQFGMTIVRLFGDYIRNNFKNINILTVCTVFGFIGLSLFIFTKNIYFAILGNFLLGVCIAPLSPILTSTVANYNISNSATNIGFLYSIMGAFNAITPGILGYISSFTKTLTETIMIIYITIGLGFVIFLFYSRIKDKEKV